jgi:hypothetical protein
MSARPLLGSVSPSNERQWELIPKDQSGTEDHIFSVPASRRGREAAFAASSFPIPLETCCSNFSRRAKALAQRRLVILSADQGERTAVWVELSQTGIAAIKRLMDYWSPAFRSI